MFKYKTHWRRGDIPHHPRPLRTPLGMSTYAAGVIGKYQQRKKTKTSKLFKCGIITSLLAIQISTYINLFDREIRDRNII